LENRTNRNKKIIGTFSQAAVSVVALYIHTGLSLTFPLNYVRFTGNGHGRSHEIRIMKKVLIGTGGIASATGAAIYVLPTILGTTAAADHLPLTLGISLGALATLALLLLRTLMAPLKDVTEAVRILAKGNFRDKVYHGKITRSTVRNASELDRAILMLELLRRKIIEGKKNLNESMKQKAIDLQRINDELSESEQILKKANLQLEAQAEEFKRMNEELSSTNEELLATNSRLKDLDKMKDDFISVAAQELCIPLEPILDSVDQLERGTIGDDEAWKSIVAGSRQLVGVANNILDVGRIEGGSFDYKLGPVSVRKLVDEVTTLISTHKGRSASAKIMLDMDPDGDIMITGDKKRLVQAVSAILANSIAYTDQGTIKLQVRANHDDGTVDIRVIDDGLAFPVDVIPVLFDKYAARMRENERGTGLGLFICRTIIEAHGGNISVENNKSDKGVTFAVSLPTNVKKEVSQIAQAQ
jgi:signal transduction histidine kinase